VKAHLILLFAASTVHLYGTPTIEIVSATPTTAAVGTPTEISVRASINDPSLIVGSVTLLQLNPDGTTTFLGVLHDDGLNGDAYAGDLIFTLNVTLSTPTASQIRLQVSAAFKGVLQRVKSPVVRIFFQPANRSAAANHAGASYTGVLGALTQSSRNRLAASINAGVLAGSQNDLRSFQSTFVAPDVTMGRAVLIQAARALNSREGCFESTSVDECAVVAFLKTLRVLSLVETGDSISYENYRSPWSRL
jgi:hypothetical protein